MAKPARPVKTVTVIGSNPAMSASGAAALILHTLELGPVAFDVDMHAIEVIRKALTDCEIRLRQQKGTA